MLVIHPDECIDCGVCEPECPVDAIKPTIPRSEMMPRMLVPSSETTRAPTSSSRIRRMASATVTLGLTVRTSPFPLARKRGHFARDNRCYRHQMPHDISEDRYESKFRWVDRMPLSDPQQTRGSRAGKAFVGQWAHMRRQGRRVGCSLQVRAVQAPLSGRRCRRRRSPPSVSRPPPRWAVADKASRQRVPGSGAAERRWGCTSLRISLGFMSTARHAPCETPEPRTRSAAAMLASPARLSTSAVVSSHRGFARMMRASRSRAVQVASGP